MASVCALAAFAAASNANADPVLQMQLQSGGTTYSDSPGASPLTLTESIGNFTTTVNTGTATTVPSLDLSSVDINSSAGGTLVVTLSASGFTSPVGAANWLSQFSGNFVIGSGTVELQTYLNNNDTLLSLNGATLLNTLTDTATPFGLSDVTSALADGSFALTEVLTITTTGAAHVSLDGSITEVPEPASMALLGIGMIGTGVMARRRRPSMPTVAARV